jgi:hypothetical protein
MPNSFMKIKCFLLTKFIRFFIIYKNIKILFYFLNLNRILRFKTQNNNTFDSCKLLILTSILLISIDCVIFGYDDTQLKVLIGKLK